MPGEPGYESLMSLSQWTPGSHPHITYITIIYNQPLVPSLPLRHMCLNHSCPCHNGLQVVSLYHPITHITIIYNQPLVPSSPLHHMCMNHSCRCHNGLQVVTPQQKAHITIIYYHSLVPSSPLHHMYTNHSCPCHNGHQVVTPQQKAHKHTNSLNPITLITITP